MTYQDSLNYLAGLEKMGIRLGLAPVMHLLNRLDNPQDKYPSILIAGTNGKGSISAMAASVLSSAGFKCGLYTSPHLVDVRERIAINGRMIPSKAFAACIEEIKKRKIEEVTYFEFLTVAAFLYFAKENIDVAVLEVGMGGRLDATNCVNPAVSVVSNIALEHTEYLGNTLAKIAREKGGIIRKGGTCITAARQKRVIDVLSDICTEKNAILYRIGKDIKTALHKDGSFSYRGLNTNFSHMQTSLVGRHQVENAACAIGVIEFMRKSPHPTFIKGGQGGIFIPRDVPAGSSGGIGRKGFKIDDDAIIRGIKNARWPGRMEVIRKAPTVILDGAHNPAGVKALCRTLKTAFSYRKLIVVFGVLRDKDYGTMVHHLASLADELIITSPDTERALPLTDLLPIARQYKKTARAVKKPIDALKKALAMATSDDLICVAGSLYLVGDIKKDFPLIQK